MHWLSICASYPCLLLLHSTASKCNGIFLLSLILAGHCCCIQQTVSAKALSKWAFMSLTSLVTGCCCCCFTQQTVSAMALSKWAFMYLILTCYCCCIKQAVSAMALSEWAFIYLILACCCCYIQQKVSAMIEHSCLLSSLVAAAAFNSQYVQWQALS